MKEKALKYLSYFTMLFGLSLLGIAFVFYMIVLSASIGILFTNYTVYNYIESSIGLNIPSVYCNLFFMLFSFGSLGAILTYVGSTLIPQIKKHK